MIQRIQSLYLLGSFILIAVMFFFPLAELTATAGTYLFNYRGIAALTEGEPAIFTAWPVAILLTVIALVTLITLFMFKKRILQIRLTIFNMVCMVGAMGLIYYSISSQAKELDAITDYSLINAFPLVALVLSFMALRNIGKDEALIRSMDRLR